MNLLINTRLLRSDPKPQETDRGPAVLPLKNGNDRFVSDRDQLITRVMGDLEPGENIHFYSWANFNLVRLILHIIRQTGPANLLMTSYSFSQKSIESLLARKNSGHLLDIRILVDNRVRTMSPKPFQMLAASFNYRCTSVHAKVALIYNENWKISIVTSQNATDNPKLERGIIYTDKSVFDFDYKILENEFNTGTT